MDLSQRDLQTNGKLFSNSEVFFKRIARCGYWPNCNVLCINGLVSTSSTNYWFFFQITKLIFEILAENQKIFKRIARREYWSNCNMLYSKTSLNRTLLFQKVVRFSKISVYTKCRIAPANQTKFGLWEAFRMCRLASCKQIRTLFR